MNTAKADYSFNVNSEGKNHHFTYKKATLGFKMALPMLWPALIIGGYLALQSSKSLSTGITVWIFYTVGIAAGIVFLLNIFRTGGKFTVDETGIIINDTNYPYTNIHSMYIKSPKGEKGYTLIQESGGYGVPGAMKAAGNAGVAMSAAAGEDMRASLREKNYKVCILYGEKKKYSQAE